MALKLPDSAVPMGDFPVAKAVDIDFDDGENLQEKLDNGKLGGEGNTTDEVVKKTDIATTIDLSSTDEQVASAKAVYDELTTAMGKKANASDIPTKVSELTNDSNYQTAKQVNSAVTTEIAKVGTKLKLINLGGNVDANNCRIEENINCVYGYFGEFTQNVPSKGYAVIICYQYGSGIRQVIYYTTRTIKTFTRFIQYDGKIPTDWKELATVDKLTEMNTKISQLETQASDLFQSVSDGKTLVANAITGKGVSTSTTATFATMATNIGKINGYGYKEETKSKTFSTTGISVLTITFSANVLAIKQIVTPSSSCSIVLQSSNNIYTINGKELIVHVTGGGTWSFTALIQN